MSDFLLPAFFYQSSILAIDDNVDFLTAIKFNLRNYYNINIYDDINQALKYIKETKHFPETIKSICHDDTEDFEFDEIKFGFNPQELHNAIENGQRFNELSVVLLDYAMPNKNGLEVARLIRNINKNIKIIMLTGEATLDQVLKAFNAQDIDFYVDKQDENLNVILINAIKKLQLKMSLEFTQILLSNTSSNQLDYLKNIDCCDVIKSYLDKFDIVEYYIIDAEGGILCFDENAKASFLSIKTINQVKTLLEIAKNADDVDRSILNDLKNFVEIPFFYQSEYDLLPENWRPNMHEASMINNKYLYSAITNCDRYKFNIENYQHFLERSMKN